MKRSDPVRRGSGEIPTHPSLLGRPLDFICEDHLRERQVCAMIDGLTMVRSLDRQAVLTVLRFLNEELNVHLRDEAEDLFPVLEMRCTAEDSINAVLGRIREDQGQTLSQLSAVREAIAGSLDTGADLSQTNRETLTRFAAHVRRHLVAENAILLPIARARLTKADLRRLASRMRSRRGLPPGAEVGHAD